MERNPTREAVVQLRQGFMQDWLMKRQNPPVPDWKEEAQWRQQPVDPPCLGLPVSHDTPRSNEFARFKAKPKVMVNIMAEVEEDPTDTPPPRRVKLDRFAGDLATGPTIDVLHLLPPCQELVATIKRGALRFQVGDASFGFNGPEFKDNRMRCEWAMANATQVAAPIAMSEISFASWSSLEEQRITRHEQHCHEIANRLADFANKIQDSAAQVSMIAAKSECQESPKEVDLRLSKSLDRWHGLVEMYKSVVEEAKEIEPWRTRDDYRMESGTGGDKSDPVRGGEALWFDVLDVHTTESPESIQKRVNHQIAKEQAALPPGVDLSSAAWERGEAVLLEAAGQQFFCTVCGDGAAFYESREGGKELRGASLAWGGDKYAFLGHRLVWEWQRKCPPGEVEEAFILLRMHLEGLPLSLPRAAGGERKGLVPGRSDFIIQMALYAVYQKQGPVGPFGGKILVRRPVEAIRMSDKADRITAFQQELQVAKQVSAKYFSGTPEEAFLEKHQGQASLRHLILYPREAEFSADWVPLTALSEDSIAKIAMRNDKEGDYGASPAERHVYGVAKWVQEGQKSFR